jgi:hypothetical protein
MKRKFAWKKILKMIINVLMLLSLSGCEGCEGWPAYKLTVHNRSSMTVKVAVVGAEGGGTDENSNYLTLSPGKNGFFEIPHGSTGFFVAKAQPVDDWLKYAEQRRQKILRILSSVGAANPDLTPFGESGKTVADLQAEMHQLADKINSSKGKSKEKQCRGVIYTGQNDSPGSLEPYVLITDSESPNSIIIACLYQ